MKIVENKDATSKKKVTLFEQKGGWLPQIQLKFMQNSSIFFVRLFQF